MLPRVVAAFALFLAAPTVAQAEERDLIAACTRAAAIQLGADDASASNTQVFAELTPPRVQIDVFGKPDQKGDAIAALLDGDASAPGKPRHLATVRCTFESASLPLKLVSFECTDFACMVDEGRTEELQVLLAREGY